MRYNLLKTHLIGKIKKMNQTLKLENDGQKRKNA